ncbi:MAG: WD40 repeat domain-containing protein [Leptolyngbyaceae cyanobacterium]
MRERLHEWHSRNSLELVGQAEAIEYLTRQLYSSPHQLICVSGLPMVGKTDLVQIVISTLMSQQRSTDHGNFILHWVEAETAQTVATLYQHVHKNRHDAQSSDLDQLEVMALLIDELRDYPLLIILNDADILYEPGQLAGVLRESSGYHRLLRQMVNDPTLKGRLVWVSRVLPQPLEANRITLYKHRVLPLSVEQLLTLLNRRRLFKEATEKQHQLIEFCGGNPGLLLVAARKVRESCGGQVDMFVRNPLRYLSQEGEYWRQAIAVISEIEQVLLVWLLLRPWSYEGIMALTLPGITDGQRIQALESLRKRDFILEQDNEYHLHPPYLRYVVAAWLVETVGTKILEKQGFTGIRYPLTLPQGAAWRRQWQQQQVLEPLAGVIKNEYWSRAAQQELFAELLTAMSIERQASPRQDYSYALGTLLTIAIALGLQLTQLALNGQTMRQVDLWGKSLNGLQASHCRFVESVLPVCFEGLLAADMSADGQAISIGDSTGRVGYWVRSGETFRLHKYHRFRTLPGHSVAITALSINQRDVVVMATDTSVYRWWTGDQAHPAKQTAVDGLVRQLAHSGDYIAAGLQDGSIWVYDRTTLSSGHQRKHVGAVSILSFDPDGFELVSIGHGNRALRWDLTANPMPAIQDVLPTDGRILWSVHWREGQLLLAGTREGIPAVKWGETLWQTLPGVKAIGRLAFSRNTDWLAGCDYQGGFHLWNQSFEVVLQIALLESCPEKMVISNDGKSLLTVNTHYNGSQADSCIQLWDVQVGHLLWEITTSQPSLASLSLESAVGLSAAEQQHLQEFSEPQA